jgi:Fe-S oxidoreductase
MATYKAEFLAHHYRGRLRPRSAYAFGLVDRWARMAALAPGLVNLIARAPGLSAVVKLLAGMARGRAVPRFAPRTFRRWFRGARRKRGGGRPVLLWPDTFTNHFQPDIAIAAVGVLEAAGFEVRLPRAGLCCGRPLYDHGMLVRAKRLLRTTMDALRTELEQGLPIVVLEPSCLAVFRDELPALYPDDPLARRLAAQSCTLSQLLVREQRHHDLPRVPARALVQRHCHQAALFGSDAEEEAMAAAGLTVSTLDAGCCGMAGSFGFEAAHHELSMRIGERALLPAVRAQPADALIVADGFSCREQILQGAGRRALHSAEVLRRSLPEVR